MSRSDSLAPALCFRPAPERAQQNLRFMKNANSEAVVIMATPPHNAHLRSLEPELHHAIDFAAWNVSAGIIHGTR
jgi:hypothetical protein